VISNVTKYLHAIPQYNLGHSARIGALEAAQAGTNIWLTGSYLHGPSIGSCLDCSLSIAEAVRISYNT
jgi:protoporphyrinogen oxidase